MLESVDVVRRYNGLTAVDHVSLRLEPGHIYAMLGPNGSGKTTWMKMAADLVIPDAGEMRWQGKPVSRRSRLQVAYMPTEAYFYHGMTIRQAGLYYRDFFRDYDLQKLMALLKKMHLDRRMRINELSSGMMAKLKVAIILCRRAGAYLMDEPFNGIDLISRDEIAEAIAETFTPQTVMVLSSHLVEELEGLADTAVFMREGKLVGVRDIAQLRQETGLSLSDVYRRVYGEERWDLRC